MKIYRHTVINTAQSTETGQKQGDDKTGRCRHRCQRVTISPQRGAIYIDRHRHPADRISRSVRTFRGLESACLRAFPALFPCKAILYMPTLKNGLLKRNIRAGKGDKDGKD